MIFVLVAISMVAFVIIQLPPGDYVTNMIDNMRLRGERVTDELIELLAKRYGLNMPLHQQYLKWAWRILHGDFGRSMETSGRSRTDRRPAHTYRDHIDDHPGIHLRHGDTDRHLLCYPPVLGRRLPVDLLRLHWPGHAEFPAGNDLDAGLLQHLRDGCRRTVLGGIRVVWLEHRQGLDLIKHLPIPIVVLGTAGTAGLIRVLRGSLLDELAKNYVVTAQAKGLPESRLIFKYPVRIALNPIISQVSNLLPAIVSGSTITSIVLNLPTVGPLLFGALQAQDMHLAAALVLMVSTLGVIGTLISDILLAIVDPRIRLEK